MKLNFLFCAIANDLVEASDLRRANLYDDFATLEFVSEDKKFTISIKCEDAKDGNS